VEDAVTEGREVNAAAGAGLPRHAATGVVVAVATTAGAETGFRGRLERCVGEEEENSGSEIFTATVPSGWGKREPQIHHRTV